MFNIADFTLPTSSLREFFKDVPRGYCIVCGKPVPGGHRWKSITCSDTCHEAFVHKLEQRFGGYKKVTDMESGISYKVPTRYIIEKGLKQQELKNFPKWEE